MAVAANDVDVDKFVLVSHRKGVDSLDVRPYMIEDGATLSNDLENGGWEVTATIADPTGRIRRHPIFGDPENEHLDAVDVEIDGTWFRLRRLERGPDATLTLSFQERGIDRIARHHEPIVTSRNKATRREFIVARAKAGGAEHTYSPMLHVHRRILASEEPVSDDVSRTHSERGDTVGGSAKGGPEEFRGPANKWGQKYKVDPWVLMGIGKIETGFWTNRNTSSAGAQGPMQFMPATRASILKSSGHDAYESIDQAVAAAAYYLHSSGYKIGNDQAIRNAIHTYNRSWAYVDDVLAAGKKYRGDAPASDGSDPVLNEGDSLAVGSGPKLADIVSNKVQTRAKVGRSTAVGLADIKELKETPDTWVIQLGTNDFDLDVFKRNAAAIVRLGKEKTIIWVNIKRASHAGQAIDTQMNEVLEDLAANHDNLTIADWKDLVERQNITMDSESIHPDAEGYKLRAEMIADFLKRNSTDPSTGASTTKTIAKSYTFRVGEMQEDGHRQNWWEGIQDLSDVTRLRSFFDRGVFICMSEEELERAEAVAGLSEAEDEVTLAWDFDNGDTEKSITITCQSTRWAFPPGACIVIHDEGRADGRYIVVSKERTLFNQATTIVARKPLPELPEPAHDTDEVTVENDPSFPTDPGDDPGAGGTVNLGGEQVNRVIGADGQYGRGWQESSKGVHGPTNTSGHTHWHSGVDYSVPSGTACYAPVDGEISFVQAVWSDGGMVHFKFLHDVGNIKAGTMIGWGHCQNIRVHQGQKVKAGQRVCDSNHPQPHVHFVVRTPGSGPGGGDGNTDPVPILKALQSGDGSSNKRTPAMDQKQSGN